MKLNRSKEKKKQYKSQNNYQGKIINQCKISNPLAMKPFKLITNLRQSFLSLPSTHDIYVIQNQLHYLARLSQILSVLSLHTKQNKKILSSQMIFASIEPQAELKQLISIFNNFTEHKQIVIAIWIEIYSRVLDYVVEVVIDKKQSKHTVSELEKSHQFLLYLSKDVFESVQFLLEFQCGLNGFKINQHGQQSSIKQTARLLILQFKWIQENLQKIIFQQESKLKLITKHFQSVTQIADKATINNKSSLLVILVSIKQLSSFVLRYLPVIMKMTL